MTKHVTKVVGWSASLIALAATASADIKLNDNFKVGGYMAASYEYFKPDPGPSSDSLFNGGADTPSADALKTIFTAEFKPVTGVVSLFYIPNIPSGVMRNETTILDAYVAYDAGGGVTITGGKFLSYLGYEAFDPVNMSQITYSPVTVGTLGSIPAYHTGVKFDYSEPTFGAGFAILDSVFSPKGIDKGDGELKHNAGFEGYVKFTGVPDLVLWAGFAHDTKGNFQSHKVTVLDFWAEYKVTKMLTVAGEFLSKDGGDFNKGTTWLAYVNYAFTDKYSVVGRIGGENLGGKTAGSDFIQYTVGPSAKITDNLTVRAEYSYYDYDGGFSKSLFGVQAIFKF
ncbi:MAG: outer membrane beta-barrel protein [Opitutaceae bacterium]